MSKQAASLDRADAPRWVDRLENPYLHGIYAPTIQETTASELEVEGELPQDLYGAYVRNGPNSFFEPTNLYHWFDGDGMVHAVYFRDGQVSYRSRFVRTEGIEDEMRAGRANWPGIMGLSTSTCLGTTSRTRRTRTCSTGTGTCSRSGTCAESPTGSIR